MPIMPLPQFEADLEEDRKVYERLKPPTSIVVRFGIMKMVGEFSYSGDAKPGCGSKIVVRTHRGVELGEMLTSTCPNSGCSKSVTRKEMLEYIDRSGGRDYPFFTQGKVVRIATAEDLNEQAKLDASRPQMTRSARAMADRMMLKMKVVDSEPILGGDRLTFYFTSEDRIDFRELVNELAKDHRARIDMRQVGARDEARLVADYEKCGQHCCCKQFLKVLKPVSMKSAKIQKATLDPLKISGRCGRLMCCLRYEDSTYDELRKRLPHKKTRVETPEGWGIVIDSQILTQLVLVQLEGKDEQIAVPVEELGGVSRGAARAAPVDEADGDDESDELPGAGTSAPAAAPPVESGRAETAPSQPSSQQPRPRADGARGGGGGGGGRDQRGGGQGSGRPERSGPPQADSRGPRPGQGPGSGGRGPRDRQGPARTDGRPGQGGGPQGPANPGSRPPGEAVAPTGASGMESGRADGGPPRSGDEGAGGGERKGKRRRRRRRRPGGPGEGGAPSGGGGGGAAPAG